jgi:hypothetical protein
MPRKNTVSSESSVICVKRLRDVITYWCWVRRNNYKRAHILHKTELNNCVQAFSQSIRVTKEIPHSTSVMSMCLVLTLEQLFT